MLEGTFERVEAEVRERCVVRRVLLRVVRCGPSRLGRLGDGDGEGEGRGGRERRQGWNRGGTNSAPSSCALTRIRRGFRRRDKNLETVSEGRVCQMNDPGRDASTTSDRARKWSSGNRNRGRMRRVRCSHVHLVVYIATSAARRVLHETRRPGNDSRASSRRD